MSLKITNYSTGSCVRYVYYSDDEYTMEELINRIEIDRNLERPS